MSSVSALESPRTSRNERASGTGGITGCEAPQPTSVEPVIQQTDPKSGDGDSPTDDDFDGPILSPRSFFNFNLREKAIQIRETGDLAVSSDHAEYKRPPSSTAERPPTRNEDRSGALRSFFPSGLGLVEPMPAAARPANHAHLGRPNQRQPEEGNAAPHSSARSDPPSEQPTSRDRTSSTKHSLVAGIPPHPSVGGQTPFSAVPCLGSSPEIGKKISAAP